MIQILLFFFFIYYALSILEYWTPLWAVLRKPAPPLPPDLASEEKPRLVVLAPCRHAAGSIGGFIQTFKNQDYPPERYRIVTLIDTESSDDLSPAIARAAGAEVYERRNPEIHTKGNAVNDWLTRSAAESWDAILVIDVDGRVDSHFLSRVAAYLRGGAQVIQCSPVSKNASQNAYAGLNHSGQLLSQMIESGRARLGLSAILSGTGMVFSREALRRLEWKTSTGRHLSDDGELNLRCYLKAIPVAYGPDLRLLNDLPADPHEVRRQRRRWFAAYVEALPYIRPLLRKGITEDPRVLEGLFHLVFLPGCSVTFALAGVGVLGLGLASIARPLWLPWYGAFLALWIIHSVYYLVALRTIGGFPDGSAWKTLPAFLAIRMKAIFEGAVLGSRINPGSHSIPSEHHDSTGGI